MTKTVNIHAAKTHLSRLLIEAGTGTEIIIAKSGKPVAKLVSVSERQKRTPGRFINKIRFPIKTESIPLPSSQLSLFD